MNLDENIELLLKQTARHFLCNSRIRMAEEIEKLHDIRESMIEELTGMIYEERVPAVSLSELLRTYNSLIDRVVDGHRMYLADELNEYRSSSKDVRDKAIDNLRKFVDELRSTV